MVFFPHLISQASNKNVTFALNGAKCFNLHKLLLPSKNWMPKTQSTSVFQKSSEPPLPEQNPKPRAKVKTQNNHKIVGETTQVFQATKARRSARGLTRKLEVEAGEISPNKMGSSRNFWRPRLICWCASNGRSSELKSIKVGRCDGPAKKFLNPESVFQEEVFEQSTDRW